MKVKLAIYATSLLTFIGGTLNANENETTTRLQPITVTSTNLYETDIANISKPVSVIDEEDIKMKNPTNIIEIMKNTAGVGFSRAGSLGGQLVMRGFNSNDLKIPMSINGERFRGRNTLEYNIIDPARVEKIEIIRGPAAAIYGSEAMAGMVNVVMKKSEIDFSNDFKFKPIIQNVTYESVNNLKGTRIEAQGAGYGIDVLIGASYKEADDYNTQEGKALNSNFKTKAIDGSIGYSFNEKSRLGFNFKISETEAHRAGGLGSAPGMYAPIGKQVYLSERPIKEKYFGLTYDLNPNIKSIEKMHSSVYRRTLWTDVVSTKYPNPDSVQEVHRYVVGPVMYGGKLHLISKPILSTVLTAGIDFYLQNWEGAEQEIKGKGTVTSVARKKVESNSKQNNFGTFILMENSPTNWLVLSSNLRYDYYKTKNDANIITIPALAEKIKQNKETSDDIITYAIGAVLKPKDWINFSFNYGTSYRTPTVNELFGYGRYGAGYMIPNPELNPEKSNTIDFTTRLFFENLTASATIYKSKYKNLITTKEITFLDTTSRQRFNIGKATVEGLEFDLNYALTNNLFLTYNGAYTKGTDEISNKPIKYIAPFVSNLALRYDGNNFYVSGHTKYSKAKTRIDTSAERKTSAYVVYDVYAGIELKKIFNYFDKTTLRFGIENIFNKKYVDATTREDIRSPKSLSNPLLEPGRNFKISLATRF